MEQIVGIEPTPLVWKTMMLPLTPYLHIRATILYCGDGHPQLTDKYTCTRHACLSYVPMYDLQYYLDYISPLKIRQCHVQINQILCIVLLYMILAELVLPILESL